MKSKNIIAYYDKAAAARWIKNAKKVFCSEYDPDQDGRPRWIVFDGYAVFVFDQLLYEEVIQPATCYPPGNWTIDRNRDGKSAKPAPQPGPTTGICDIMHQLRKDSDSKMTAANIHFITEDGRALEMFYNIEKDFSAGYNPAFLDIVPAECREAMTAASSTGICGIKANGEYIAGVLPVRISNSAAAAARAAVTGSAKPDGEKQIDAARQEAAEAKRAARELSRELETLKEEREKAENSRQDAPKQPRRYKLPTEPQKALKAAILSRSETARELEHLREKITRQTDEKRALIDEAERWREKYDQAAGLVKELTETAQQQRAKVQELEAAHEGDADAAAIIRELRERVKELETARPAKPAGVVPEAVQAIIDKFRAIPGAAVTVKGAASAAPVVWITGGDPEQITAAGGIWSAKRAAYWCKA